MKTKWIIIGSIVAGAAAVLIIARNTAAKSSPGNSVDGPGTVFIPTGVDLPPNWSKPKFFDTWNFSDLVF